jgi:inner membrane protein
MSSPFLPAPRSTVRKMAGIGFLVPLLLVPLGQIESVLQERLTRRRQAVDEITQSWGQMQTVVGPVLMIPYRYQEKVWKDRTTNGRVEPVEVLETRTDRAYFLPDQLAVGATLDPHRLYRGIYDTVVYRSALTVSGRFAPPDLGTLGIDPRDVVWDEATLSLAVSDLRGVQEALDMQWGTERLRLVPGTTLEDFPSGVEVRVPGLQQPRDGIPFALDLTLNGSEELRVAPVGVTNAVRVSSSWPDPGFRGAFLPAERTIGPTGFEAQWRVSYYGRGYPQAWTGRAPGSVPFDSRAVSSSLIGVELVSLVDGYRTVERAIKYGVLFITLVFTTFFLFEVLARLRIHPFQYTLVGACLCLFFLALLSLSELVRFGVAYLVAASASALLVMGYAVALLRVVRRALVVGTALAAVYGFLYVILQLQDYSLVVGTSGLFLVLAIVMYATRSIDWYRRDAEVTATG